MRINKPVLGKSHLRGTASNQCTRIEHDCTRDEVQNSNSTVLGDDNSGVGTEVFVQRCAVAENLSIGSDCSEGAVDDSGRNGRCTEEGWGMERLGPSLKSGELGGSSVCARQNTVAMKLGPGMQRKMKTISLGVEGLESAGSSRVEVDLGDTCQTRYRHSKNVAYLSICGHNPDNARVPRKCECLGHAMIRNHTTGSTSVPKQTSCEGLEMEHNRRWSVLQPVKFS